MQQTSKQKFAYLDILRIIATFGVIFLHVFASGYHTSFLSYNWYISVIGDSLVRWSVPIFVMISGTLFLSPLRNITIKEIFYKRISRLFLAYVSWCLIYSVIAITLSIIKHNGVYDFKFGHFVPHFHLWFLPMLGGVYVLIPFLRRIVTDNNLLKYALIIWAWYVFGSFVVKIEIPQISSLLRMNIVIGYCGYFLLGFYVSNYDITRKQKKIIYILGILGALITIFGNIIVSIILDSPNGIFLSNLSIHVILMSLAIFVFIKDITPKIESKIQWFINHVKKDLFGIYLIHAFWLMIINRDFIRNICDHMIILPIISILIFFLSLYSTKLIRKIPFVRKIVE